MGCSWKCVGTAARKYRNRMKVMDSCSGQGASRSEGRAPSQGLQRGHGREDALSCFDIFGLQYLCKGCARKVHGACAGWPATCLHPCIGPPTPLQARTPMLYQAYQTQSDLMSPF